MTLVGADEITFEVPAPLDAQSAPAARSYSGLAVVEDGRWVAVAQELGTVAEGGTADEALDNLQAAVLDVLEIAAEEGLPIGEPVPDDELARLVVGHREHSNAPVTLRTIIVPPATL